MRATVFGLAILTLLATAACRQQRTAAPSKAAAKAPAEAPAQSAAGAPAEAQTTPPAAASTTAKEVSPLPMPDLGYSARQGRLLFDHYCSTCHGAEGHGDGFNAFNLDPRPQDLGDPKFLAQHSDEEIAAVIRGGGPSAGLSSGMPPWGRTLSARQIDQLVDYIRTLKPEED